MEKVQSNWFKGWFNSKHYHILYRHRDHEEARKFIKNLFQFLKPPAGAKVLDLACGKGRHAIQVSDLGFKAVGLDLSRESIADAKKFESESLKFDCGDMRNLSYRNEFDLVLNLFTSFGYFEKEEDDLKVIRSVSKALKNGGLLILDYLNVEKVKPQLPKKEQVKSGGISFEINKCIADNFIVKNINFRDQGEAKTARELVKLIDKPMFENFFNKVGLTTQFVFGDYNLNPYDVKKSDRLIMIAKKNSN